MMSDNQTSGPTSGPWSRTTHEKQSRVMRQAVPTPSQLAAHGPVSNGRECEFDAEIVLAVGEDDDNDHVHPAI